MKRLLETFITTSSIDTLTIQHIQCLKDKNCLK